MHACKFIILDGKGEIMRANGLSKLRNGPPMRVYVAEDSGVCSTRVCQCGALGASVPTSTSYCAEFSTQKSTMGGRLLLIW